MECICCRCGAPQSGGSDTLCLKVPHSEHSYYSHCFCCGQPPKMKCLYCNAWRDLDIWQAHGPCLIGSVHLFVYSEPWPPFPNHTPHPHQQGMVITVGKSQNLNSTTEIAAEPNMQMQEPPADDSVAVESAEEVEEPVDVKPRISADKAKWVSIGDIRKWSSCIRCGMNKSVKSGWVRHAQMCGQDPKFASSKFFMYLHTKAWCNRLVADSKWEKHSNPENGECAVCRICRKDKKPLPYQPDPPARKNQNALQKQHRARFISNLKKRRESIAVDAQARTPRENSTLQIISCRTLQN